MKYNTLDLGSKHTYVIMLQHFPIWLLPYFKYFSQAIHIRWGRGSQSPLKHCHTNNGLRNLLHNLSYLISCKSSHLNYLVLSWYLYKPKSLQLSLNKVSLLQTEIRNHRSDPRYTWVWWKKMCFGPRMRMLSVKRLLTCQGCSLAAKCSTEHTM